MAGARIQSREGLQTVAAGGHRPQPWGRCLSPSGPLPSQLLPKVGRGPDTVIDVSCLVTSAQKLLPGRETNSAVLDDLPTGWRTRPLHSFACRCVSICMCKREYLHSV